ncbi:unnamed protein product [Rotaria sordida]|uniref:Uncharacterized protein n=1 Tax=Rotaria sordida TaxID=392033 RepID=A0A814SHZ9_9BILA|nr:unnamed protein product [Rotaria sordida]CAF1384018.1 unnamed protein product [Rotaria sordida]
MSSELEVTQFTEFRIDGEEKIIGSTMPLYAAIAASPEYVIYYENKILSIYDQSQSCKKTISWSEKAGHIIDICWYNNKQFIILTKREFHLFDVDTEQIRMIHSLPKNDNDDSTYYRCTSHDECIMLCFSCPGTTIEEWTLTKCKKRWRSPKSCRQDEHICCLRLLSNILGLTIAKSTQEPRFELRQSETMSVLFSMQLTCQCYRFISMNDHNWLLVPYYYGRQVLLLINTSEKILKIIDIPLLIHTYDYNGNVNQMIWNVALMSGNNSYLIVRRDRSICFHNIK